MRPEPKFDEFKKLTKDIEHGDPLIDPLKQAVADVLDELHSNSLLLPDPNDYNKHKLERLNFMHNTLSDIHKLLNPEIVKKPYVIYKDGKTPEDEDAILSQEEVDVPAHKNLRVMFLSSYMSPENAHTQIANEANEVENLINEIQSQIQSIDTTKSPILTKIKWLGTQKELAELIVELEKKEWIAKIENGERAKTCNSILGLFDISETKKSKGSNSEKAFIQTMTPDTDRKTKTQSYIRIYTTRYIPRFDKIESNKTH